MVICVMTTGEKTNEAGFMTRALSLARRGRTSPNPMVGAVVVKNGLVVGEGYHPRAGEPHAEVFALRAAGSKARGAVMYVSLEPCCHQGRTPPCTRAIIDAGVRCVVAAMADPDPKVAGQGFSELKKAGVEVRFPLCEDAARDLNKAYIKHRTTGLPYVILKSAMSLDGKIATRTGNSKWITGDRARAYAHRIRSRVDAILVGANTARLDNPTLTARLPRKVYYPARVVISHGGNLPPDLEMFKQPGESIVACAKSSDASALRKLEAAGARILTVRESGGKLSIVDLLKKLGKLGYLSVLVEGGGEVAACALEERVVDEIVYFVAPKIIGGSSAPAVVAGLGAATVESAICLENMKVRKLGRDLVVEARPIYPD